MNRRFFTLMLSAVFGLLSLPAWAGGKAGEAPFVSFHIESDGNDNPKMLIPGNVGGRQRAFRRLPEISAKDIESFSPFPAADGSTYGVLFKLKEGAARRLSAITASNPDKWLLAMVNGRGVDAVMIDKQVNDGLIVIWKNVTAVEIQQYDKLVPRIGETKKKK